MTIAITKELPESSFTLPLELCSIDAGYGANRIVCDLSLGLKTSEKVLLAGPNGCGKSTLVKSVVGLTHILRGDVLINGKSLAGVPTEKRISMGLAYMPQQRNVFTSLTVEENLKLSQLIFTTSPKRDLLSLIFETFPFLTAKLQLRAGALSGGERQALAIAMTARPDAPVWLLDEPCAGLSPKAAFAILEGLRKLHCQLGFAFIIVEHNLKYLCEWMDRALIMSNGRIVEETTLVSELLKRESIERHFFQS